MITGVDHHMHHISGLLLLMLASTVGAAPVKLACEVTWLSDGHVFRFTYDFDAQKRTLDGHRSGVPWDVGYNMENVVYINDDTIQILTKDAGKDSVRVEIARTTGRTTSYDLKDRNHIVSEGQCSPLKQAF